MKNPRDALLLQGEKHLEAGDWREAEVVFRQAVEADPTSAPALSKLGVTLVRQDRRDEAERVFARAVSADPRYAPAWSNLGNVFFESGRTEQAIEAYQRAISADPDYWLAYENLAALYKKVGRTSEQIAAQKKATRLRMQAVARPAVGSGGGRLGCLGRAATLVLMVAGIFAGAAVLALRL